MRFMRSFEAVTCLCAVTGGVVWGAQGAAAPNAATVPAEAVTDSSGALEARRGDASMGNLKWRLDLGDSGRTSLAETVPWRYYLCDGTLYLGVNSTIIAVDPSAGKEKWRFAAKAPLAERPVVLDGKVYLSANNFELSEGRQWGSYALDEATGTLLWAAPEENGLVARVGGALKYFGFSCVCHALDAVTGNELWSDANEDVAYAGGVTIAGDTIFASYGSKIVLGSLEVGVCALDAQTGRRKWRFATPQDVPYAPAVCEDVVYCGDVGMTVYALDAGSGLKKWTYRCASPLMQPPAACGGIVLVTCNDELCAIDANSGKVKWSVSGRRSIFRPPAVHEGLVFCFSLKGGLYAIAAYDGSEKWRFDGNCQVGDAVISGDTICVAAGASGLHALDAKTGAEKWQFRMKGLHAAHPAVAADGTVFFASWNYLYAVSQR